MQQETFMYRKTSWTVFFAFQREPSLWPLSKLQLFYSLHNFCCEFISWMHLNYDSYFTHSVWAYWNINLILCVSPKKETKVVVRMVEWPVQKNIFHIRSDGQGVAHLGMLSPPCLCHPAQTECLLRTGTSTTALTCPSNEVNTRLLTTFFPSSLAGTFYISCAILIGYSSQLIRWCESS
jgi:hypothetical protein